MLVFGSSDECVFDLYKNHIVHTYYNMNKDALKSAWQSESYTFLFRSLFISHTSHQLYIEYHFVISSFYFIFTFFYIYQQNLYFISYFEER